MIEHVKKLNRIENGQAFPMALVVLAIGSLLVGSFLTAVNTNFLISNVYSDPVPDNYTADAGIEDAIWGLRYGTLNDAFSINLNTIASHDFDDASWSGGTGWLNDWFYTGQVAMVTSGLPYQGTHHLLIQHDNAYIKRAVNLNGYTGVRLQFWAKAFNLEGNDIAYCYVSPDNSNWTSVKTWAAGDDDNLYKFWEIDLSSFAMTSEFWIAFDSEFNNQNDFLYIDDLRIVRNQGELTVVYTLPNPVNGTTAEVTVITPAPGGAIAAHNFNLEQWDGGIGWLGAWVHPGSITIVGDQSPAEGDRHVQIRGSNAEMIRAVNLDSHINVRLRFYGKVRSFEPGDRLYCRISSDNINWTDILVFDASYPDNIYQHLDIDLSSYTMSSNFRIAFVSGMDANDDYFYLDDVILYSGSGSRYKIISISGERTTTVIPDITDNSVSILSWEVE